MKVIAKGLFIGDDAYVKSGWNAMDGILVSISLIDLAFSAITSTENKIFGVLRVFRLLRTLRPLRSEILSFYSVHPDSGTFPRNR